MKYETFNIHVPESDLIDLRHRLKRTRLAPEIANETWEYGTNGTYLRNLLEYWEVGYDWRKHETHMNSFDNFKTIIQEIPIHFLICLAQILFTIPQTKAANDEEKIIDVPT